MTNPAPPHRELAPPTRWQEFEFRVCILIGTAFAIAAPWLLRRCFPAFFLSEPGPHAGLFRSRSNPVILVQNWRQVLKRAWSVRFIAAAFLFSVLEIALPAFDGALPIPPGAFAVLSGLTTGAAFVARLVAQSNMENPR